ncbi:MAG: DNA-directed RNA polymerase subunit omega [Mariprofundaceae bacterium]|nr:DNA-directed RNA polymerase subunit omega [Mariprofundaceae bacterium]
MARVTVEDCIRHYPNRFEMVLLATKRARQLLGGMPKLVDDGMHKAPVQALKEIGEGGITWDILFDMDEQERRRLASLEEEASQNEEF